MYLSTIDPMYKLCFMITQINQHNRKKQHTFQDNIKNRSNHKNKPNA